MLELSHVDAFYGDSQVLRGINLTLARGTRIAVLGRNGAGKTTLLSSIMNAGPRVRGGVLWEGRDLGRTPAFRRARLGLTYVVEDRRILTHLTVGENVRFGAYGAGCAPAAQAGYDPGYDRTDFPLLAELWDRLGFQLSGGQQQVVAVARGFAARPKLLLLDEPTEGLAPLIVQQLAKVVVEQCERHGTGLLLSEQNVAFARACTRFVHVLDRGELLFGGTWAQFDAQGDEVLRRLAF